MESRFLKASFETLRRVAIGLAAAIEIGDVALMAFPWPSTATRKSRTCPPQAT
jgi:hypothetical protein